MCKSDSIFPYLQSSASIKWLWNLFVDKVHFKNEWYQLQREDFLRLISFCKCWKSHDQELRSIQYLDYQENSMLCYLKFYFKQ